MIISDKQRTDLEYDIQETVHGIYSHVDHYEAQQISGCVIKAQTKTIPKTTL